MEFARLTSKAKHERIHEASQSGEENKTSEEKAKVTKWDGNGAIYAYNCDLCSYQARTGILSLVIEQLRMEHVKTKSYK